MKTELKKAIIITTCWIMLLCVVGISIVSENGFADILNLNVSAATVNDLSYEIKDGKVTITDCNESASGKLVIPSTIEGYPVTSIGDGAFRSRTGLTSITIPNSVISICDNAFSHCDRLKSVTIPDSVKSIDDFAFYECTGLTEITIPDSVTTIGDSAFGFCIGLTSVTIPDSVTSIGWGAFYGCTGLTSITIPDSVTSIGGGAFCDCTGLTSITIPDSVTSIGISAFNNSGYYNLEANWTDNVLYIGNHLIKAKQEITGDYSIKANTKTIADAAFSNCDNLTSVTIPDSVTSIGEYAFYECTGLASVTIPDSVTSIGVYAFNKVKNIMYKGVASGSPWGATYLNGYTDGNFVYRDSAKAKLVACSGLATGSVVIPANTDTICKSAFSSCSGLTAVYLPVNVTRIEESAFTGTALSDVYYEGGATDKLVLSIADNNKILNEATWHYNSKVSDMHGNPSVPDTPTNPSNPVNPTDPDKPNPPSADIPEANVIKGNSADNKKTYDYRTSVTFTANVPEGGSVQWYVDGKPAGSDSTLTVKDKTGDYTVKAVVTDKNGNQTMDEEQVTIKHGFFDIIIWFFVHLFNPGAYDVKQ